MQAALLEPDFLLIGEIRRHSGKGDIQLLDIDLTDDLADTTKHPFATNGAEVAKTDIQQPDNIQVIQPGNPVAILLQVASRMNTTHHGAHRATSDTGNFITTPFDLLDHANVRITTCTAAAQHQCYSLPHKMLAPPQFG